MLIYLLTFFLILFLALLSFSFYFLIDKNENVKFLVRYLFVILILGLATQISAIFVLPINQEFWLWKDVFGFQRIINNLSITSRLVSHFSGGNIETLIVTNFVFHFLSWIVVGIFYFLMTLKKRLYQRILVLGMLSITFIIDTFVKSVFEFGSHDFIVIFSLIPDIKDFTLLFSLALGISLEFLSRSNRIKTNV